jgi:hypothetical protein
VCKLGDILPRSVVCTVVVVSAGSMAVSKHEYMSAGQGMFTCNEGEVFKG